MDDGKNLDFDGKFFLNSSFILEPQLKRIYESLGAETQIGFQEFADHVKEIGNELVEACKLSPEGESMINEFQSALNVFQGVTQEVKQLNKNYFSVGT